MSGGLEVDTSRAGLSLVELLVVMGVIAVLFGIAGIEFRRLSAKSAVEKELRALAGDLAAARTRALFERKAVAVRLTSTTCALYSSATVTAEPLQRRALRFNLALDRVPDPMIFTPLGMIDGVDGGSICIEPHDNPAAYDSLLLTPTRMRTGKRNAGTVCNEDDIVLK